MNYYEERKSERKNHRIALLLTATIYFLIFTGIVYASNPELLPEVVKEWLNIDASKNQEEIKKELPIEQSNQKKDKA